MATLAAKYDGETIEHYTLRWQEDLTGAQRAAIASEAEKQRLWPEYRSVKPSELYVDETYQRPLSEDRVWSIVNSFTPRLFNALYCSNRNGKLYVVDGRHRLAAANILGPRIIPEVWIELRKMANVEEEAETFVDLQEKRRRITSAQRFAAKLVFKDPIALDLNKIISQYRFKVVSEKFTGSGTEIAQNEITAVGTLEAIYRAGGRARVSAVLQIVREAWDGVPPTTSAWMLRSLNRLLERNPSLSPKTMAHRLRELDPWGVIERGQRFAHSNGIAQSEAMADVLVKVAESA
jgi:hypothetical protein